MQAFDFDDLLAQSYRSDRDVLSEAGAGDSIPRHRLFAISVCFETPLPGNPEQCLVMSLEVL
jgi:hypothetical protein